MVTRGTTILTCLGLVLPLAGLAQQSCKTGIRIDGSITDPTGAVIPGAKVQASNGISTLTDAMGHYMLPCVPATSTTLTVQADGFSNATVSAHARQGETAHVNLQLAVASVQADVQVSADSGIDSGGDTVTLNTKALQGLADDPDDFLRELQVLAAAGGGDPTQAIIMVDGFQNPSALPPKSSIASIRINPDLFSARYLGPPWSGGVIEITTKPGADAFHGAAFFTDSDGVFNATDPFSVTATPAGRRRYGFELSGPILSKKSGFALALEKRDIDEFNVVNAVTLDTDGGLGPNGNGVPSRQTVSAPQRLWIASVRGDWQLTPSNVTGLSFSANVNNEGNQGVGGLTLADAGYSSLVSEYDLRFHNTQTINPNILHETHIGYSWKRTEQTPLSNTPSVQVAGYFLGGGATSQNLNDRERDLEMDDDMTVAHGRHTVAFGVQSLGLFVHDYDPNTFNGEYVFGGGSAPQLDANNNPTGQTTTISALEQYRRALLNLPGGSPTTYQVTTGTPLVPLTQWQVGVWVDDSFKLTSHLSLTSGFRYQFQTNPNIFGSNNPRIGLAWSPDKKQTWVFHTRAGFFNSPTGTSAATEVHRLNGILQRQATVYSPSYSDPLTPVPGSVQISTTNLFPPRPLQGMTFRVFVNAEHDLAHHWHARGDFYWASYWSSGRTVNINAPMVQNEVGTAPDPTAALLAPRPIAPNENMIEYQNSGHGAGSVVAFSLDQHSYKRFGLSAKYMHFNLKSNFLSPQSSYSNQGESSRISWDSKNGITLAANLNLPYKIEAATQFDAWGGVPYNVTTGTDNNGDGNFMDRPSYASAPGPGVYSTRFGLLTTNTVNGNVPANLGTRPGLVHFDMNVSRVFALNPKDRDHPRTLTFNARSANLLNHTNVTAVNTILSSGALGQPIAAETARRIELGLRFAF
ncbi:TonB-dependent receptor [Paracidobacterium acidisoli]|uniref:TonB-dependent receptor n=1 Tax=Paracidobacterium acidisoli TaxID=2303751 RepID=A0A372IPA2_9BACT|nr:carboxypeptidase regulatory-like domain-containing protein [Paracidobacterium acidisoli]MBT9332035.1 carboxypeptidase regulatory-like domain-containing protein [Paracidobacterium acidisoli]